MTIVVTTRRSVEPIKRSSGAGLSGCPAILRKPSKAHFTGRCPSKVSKYARTRFSGICIGPPPVPGSTLLIFTPDGNPLGSATNRFWGYTEVRAGRTFDKLARRFGDGRAYEVDGVDMALASESRPTTTEGPR